MARRCRCLHALEDHFRGIKGVRWALRERIDHLEDVDEWLASLDPNRRSHLNNPIDVWDQYCEDQRTHKSRLKPRPLTRQRKRQPGLLEELLAVSEALEASEQRSDMLETILQDVLATVQPEAVKCLPDDLLRRVFAKLPQQMQDTLHSRLFQTGVWPIP